MTYIIMSSLKIDLGQSDEWLKNRQEKFFKDQAIEKTIKPELKTQINQIRIREDWINEYLAKHDIPTRPEVVGMYLKLVQENCTNYADFVPFMNKAIEITEALEKMMAGAPPAKIGMYLKLVLGSKD